MRFAGMEQPVETPEVSRDFEKALRSGQFDEAAEKLDELMKDAQQMSQEERDEIADHLRNMSEQLSEIDESTIANEELDPVREAMNDLGIDAPIVDELLDKDKSEDEVASTLEEEGVDEDVARELAADAKEAQEQEEIDQQADEQTSDLADALNEAADDIANEEPQQDKSQKDDNDSGENNNDSEVDSPSDDSLSDESQDQQAQEKSENSALEKDDSSNDKATDNNEGKKQSGEEQKQNVKEERSTEQGEEPAKEPTEEQVKESGKEQDKQQKPGQQTVDPTDPNSTSQEEVLQEEDTQEPTEEFEVTDPSNPNNQQPPDEQSTRKPSNSKGDLGAKKSLPKNLGEALRELARKKRDASKGKKDSERLREAARKIADSLSDEEKRELAQKWMGEFNKPSNNTDPLPDASKDAQDTAGSFADRIVQNAKDNLEPEIEDVDVTGDNPAAKSIYEWLSDQPVTGDPQTTTQSRKVVRKARSAAEHAVGESTVPKRYHELIKRYFGKLSDTVEKAEKQTGKTDTSTKEVPAKTTTEDDS